MHSTATQAVSEMTLSEWSLRQMLQNTAIMCHQKESQVGEVENEAAEHLTTN